MRGYFVFSFGARVVQNLSLQANDTVRSRTGLPASFLVAAKQSDGWPWSLVVMEVERHDGSGTVPLWIIIRWLLRENICPSIG